MIACTLAALISPDELTLKYFDVVALRPWLFGAGIAPLSEDPAKPGVLLSQWSLY